MGAVCLRERGYERIGSRVGPGGGIYPLEILVSGDKIGRGKRSRTVA